MDDNVWEYPFGDLDDDDELFYRRPPVNFPDRPAPLVENCASI